jgi:hypothetical protein
MVARPKTVEKAVMKLPDVAAVQEETDWVTSHARFLALMQSEDGLELPPLGVREVLYATNGQAPSKRAVNQLLIATQSKKSAGDYFRTFNSKAAVALKGGDAPSQELPASVKNITQLLAGMKTALPDTS